MRLDEIVDIGQIFEIKLKDRYIRTKLQDFLDNEDFTVFQPAYDGLPFWPEHEQIFVFLFYKQDGVYTFNAQIINTYDQDGLRLCRFRQVTDVVKHQRRQAFRLPVVLDVMIEYLVDEKSGEHEITCKGKTVNLSEKSVQLTCFSYMPVKTTVKLTIFFNKSVFIVMPAEVFRCTKPAKKTDPYEVVFLFVDCFDRDLTFIRKYILQQQINAKRAKKTGEIENFERSYE